MYCSGARQYGDGIFWWHGRLRHDRPDGDQCEIRWPRPAVDPHRWHRAVVAGGDGGDVSFMALAPIQVVTTGDSATGITLQSLGGGGGNAGEVKSETTTTTAANSKFNFGASASVGGQGGSGGSAGDVSFGSATNIADLIIQTSGDNANALFIQSLGGGGGVGSNTNAGSAGGNLSVSFGMGGTGGNGGSAGEASLFADGTFSTKGASSYGVLIQSIIGLHKMTNPDRFLQR